MYRYDPPSAPGFKAAASHLSSVLDSVDLQQVVVEDANLWDNEPA